MDPRYIKIAIKWLWLLIFIPIMTAAAAYVYSSTQPTIHRAVTRLIIGPGISSPNPDLDSLRAGALLMQTYSELVHTETFRQTIIDDLDLNLTTVEVRDIIDIRPIVDTQLLNVVVDYTDPEIAVGIANAVAEEMVNLSPSSEFNDFLLNRIQEQTLRIEADLDNTESRLEDLYAELELESDPAREVVLLERIADEEGKLADGNETLAALYENLQSPFTNQVEVVDRATTAVAQSSELAITLLLAVGAGTIISLCLLAFFIFLDSLYINTEMIKRNRAYPPLLGKVRVGSRMKDSDMRILTAFLLHQFKEKQQGSLMLTGVDDSRNVAAIASELAVMLSQTGISILLIDADFTNNVIAERFELEDDSSLIDALTQDVLQAAIRPHPHYPNLHVLPSGTSTGDAFFLIASQRLARVLERVSQTVDFIIVATPAMSSFEDSVAIASWTKSSVVVVQQGKTRVVEMNKALDYLKSVGSEVRGLVVAE